MKNITKATIKKLETENFGEYTAVSTVLEQIAKATLKENNNYLGQNACLVEDDLVGNYISATVEKYIQPAFRGLSTKYSKLVETTFTHGNNGLIIRDMNKLVNELLKAQ